MIVDKMSRVKPDLRGKESIDVQVAEKGEKRRSLPVLRLCFFGIGDGIYDGEPLFLRKLPERLFEFLYGMKVQPAETAAQGRLVLGLVYHDECYKVRDFGIGGTTADFIAGDAY